MTIATGDQVTIEYVGRVADGQVFDTSREVIAEEAGLVDIQPDREYAPLTVEIGSGRMIEGLEEGLVGMEEGAETIISIPPEKGYGEWTEEDVQAFETDELRDALGEMPEVGSFLEAQNGRQGEIVHVDDEIIRVDFNPGLAGETLEFEVEILDVD